MRILQVELLASDLSSIENFYGNKLQLEVVYRNEKSITYMAGRSQLTFRLTEALQPVYHIAFEIPCNKLEEAIDWIKSKIDLIEFKKEPVVDFENLNARSVYFYDDNRNILEFIVRYDNDIKTNENFDATSILNISEVGLVTENVLNFASTLTGTYGLPHYEKQPPGDNFCAMGNSEGLFIISGSERNWFPTDTKAIKHPVCVKFEENGKVYELNYT